MVQIVENWTELAGEVVGQRGAELQGFEAVTLRLREVKPVPPYPALVKGAAGDTVDVLVPSELVAARGIRPGVKLRCRARRANLERVFVHREHLDVES